MLRFSSSSCWNVLAAIIMVAVGAQSALADVSATYELGPVTNDGNVFTIGLTLDVTTTLDEDTVFFSVDVSESDGALTNSGADYGRFAFNLAPGLTGWDQIPGTGFGSGSLQSAVEFDTITDPINAGRVQLGELTFDATGIDVAALPATISIEATGSTIGAELPNNPQSFDFVPLNFSPGTVMIPVPEPAFPVLIATGLAVIALRRRGKEA